MADFSRPMNMKGSNNRRCSQQRVQVVSHIRSYISSSELYLMLEATPHVRNYILCLKQPQVFFLFFHDTFAGWFGNIFKQLFQENRDCIPTVFSSPITFRPVFIVCKTVIQAFWRFGVFQNVLSAGSLFALLVINLLIHNGNTYFKLALLQASTAKLGQKNE